MATLDPTSPSMQLWHALLSRGVTEDEATALMNGYAHELAERIRDSAPDDVRSHPGEALHECETCAMVRAANLIDPEKTA